MARAVRRRRKGGKGCPVCGTPAVKEFAPFCSAQCRDTDLARWLGGEYRIATEETPDAEELARALEKRDREGS